MGEKTAIAWTESTHNFWIGCRKVSQGCKHCYAERQMTRYGRDFRTVTRVKSFDAPLHWKEPRTIFTCSWSDFFIEEADPWRDEAWDVIRRTPQHTYQILTKRPKRILQCLPRDWGAGWPHVWLGTSIESQEYEERLDDLVRVPAALRFVSAEPLLGPLFLDCWLSSGLIGWLIVGGESGPKARPMHMADARSLRDQAVEHGVPFFFKQQSGAYAGIRPYIVETDGSETVWQQMPKRAQPSIEAAASNQLALWEERGAMSDDDALLYGAPVHVLGGEDEPMACCARWRRSGWREMEMNGTDDRLIDVSILARRRGYLPDILIAIFGTDREHRYACVTDVSHMPYDPYDETVEPYEFRLRDEGAQDLMDSLWRCGLRPTEAAGSAGAMAEAQKHLDSLLRENVWLRQQIDRLLAGKGE